MIETLSSIEGSGEPAQIRRLTRAFVARRHKVGMQDAATDQNS